MPSANPAPTQKQVNLTIISIGFAILGLLACCGFLTKDDDSDSDPDVRTTTSTITATASPSTAAPSTVASTTSPATITTTTAIATPPAAETTTTSVYYANCTAAKAAGAAPLYEGEPGYRSKLDRDGDGVACE